MSHSALQVFKHKELITETPLDRLDEHIVATDNTTFQVIDYHTGWPVSPDCMTKCNNDLTVTVDYDDFVIEDYFSVENTCFINTHCDIDIVPDQLILDLSALISIIIDTIPDIFDGCDDIPNQAPTDITLNNNTVSENADGAIIGKITTTDADSAEFTYQISDKRFEVVDGQLKLKDGEQLDFETEPKITITVTSTDETGLSVSRDFTINVEDIIETQAPTDITLSQDTVAENAAGAIIGYLTTTDADSKAFTYTVSDERFEVVNNGELKLKDGKQLDYEKESSVTVKITSTDGSGLSTSKDFTIKITDDTTDNQSPNQAPTDITLDKNTVAENVTGAVIGKLTTADKDSTEFTYKVSDSRFEVVNGELKLKAGEKLDYEKESSVKVKVTSTDETNLSFSKDFTIKVTDVNENQAPTDITLSNNRIAENNEGAVIGKLKTTDADSKTFTYKVSDSRFEVVNGELKLKAGEQLDYEKESSITVSVTSTDETNLSFSKDFTIKVTDDTTDNQSPNQAPTDITLSNNSIAENNKGAVIGKLKTTDADSKTFTYKVSDSRFEVVNGELKLKAGEQLDFETEPKVSVKVTTTDEANLSFAKTFVINVTDDVSDNLGDIKLNINTVSENDKGAIIGTLSTKDTDGTSTYTLNSHTDKFEIVNGQLKLLDNVALDFEKDTSISLNISSSDGQNSFAKDIVVNVTDQNEALADIDSTPYFIHSLWQKYQYHPTHTPSGWAGAGNARSILYSFGGEDNNNSHNYSDFVPYSTEQQDGVRDALELYAKQFGITFKEVSSAEKDSADIVYYRANLNKNNYSGVTHYSWSNILASNEIYLNTYAYDDSSTMQPGGDAFETLLHETGHALGLKHPGNYYPGIDEPFLPIPEDREENTVMSYYQNSYVPKKALGMFDTAILEYMYGVNPDFNKGDTNYTFATKSHAISDGSGTDTLNASSQTADLTIDLTPGSWNYAGSKSDSILADGQLFIGYDTVIENLNAGSGNDNLMGNDVANTINAGEGNDTLTGGLGVDTLNGEAGNDVLIYDISDYINGGLGKDTLKITGTDDIQPSEFSRVKNVEVLDLTDSQSQQVTLSAKDVLDMTDSNHTLRVNGGSNDKVTLDGFNKGETEANYTQYTHSGATLWVDDDITPTLIA